MRKEELQDFVKTRPPLFWWLLLNILAITFAISSWVVCLNLFRDPTHPLSYELMFKVKRVPELEAYHERTLPRGVKTADPVELDALLRKLTPEQRAAFNNDILREYLTNYKRSELLTYIEGSFRIESLRPLTADDFLPSGLLLHCQAVIKAESTGQPLPYPVTLALYLPANEFPADAFSPGDLIELNKKGHGVALIHVSIEENSDGDSLALSAVHLRAGQFASPEDRPPLRITPPLKANPKAPFPPR
ncbi:MAG: hypothetical protein ACQKBY_07605 [Verrucomicrobiales bacterium]